MGEALTALLAASELFGGLSEHQLARCAARFRPVSFAAGKTIFTLGDPGSHLLLLAAGRVRLAVISAGGRELSFRLASRGDIIGEIATLDGGTRSADAVALTPVEAYMLERASLVHLIETEPILGSRVIAALCRRLRETSDQLEAIALHPIEVRLARFLVFALRGERAPPGRRIPLELGVSQSELAQLLGASRPKVNGALGALEAAGAVVRRIDRLFCDPEKLATLAGLDHG